MNYTELQKIYINRRCKEKLGKNGRNFFKDDLTIEKEYE